MPQPLRSVLAVLAGFVLTMLLSMASTVTAVHLMHLKSAHPVPGFLVVNAVVSGAAAFVGGWVAARLGGLKPLHHGLGVAMLLALVGLVALMRPAASQPYGYQLFVPVLMSFAALGGAAVGARE